jgi:hypothetical protein
MKMGKIAVGLMFIVFLFCLAGSAGMTASSEDSCVACHLKTNPGLVADWKASKHAEEGISCADCHGKSHNKETDFSQTVLPDEQLCGQCHEKQLQQFARGKHNHGWSSMLALPVTHVEPEELILGGRGCGGCHNMGIKTKAQKEAIQAKGYRYQNNSCDECHTRHSFSVKEALNPRACQQCHMGYDHPQWEMWSSAKHGTRYLTKEVGDLPKGAQAPSCQHCHMQNGDHENRTAWGFLGVRLPFPPDPQWKADRTTILKALGVLNPGTGEPTARLQAVKELDLARLTEEAWSREREKMIKVCKQCHAEPYARKQLEMGDAILQKGDRLMAEAIEIVASLYADGVIPKPADYAFAYPDLLYFMRTQGKGLDKLSYIDQILTQMYMKSRMRTYQAFFHVNPDYAYWYGWAMMVKDLGEIQELAHTLRATHKKGK